MEMTVYGKHGKPKAGFPPFPQPLEIPQEQRDSHIPTATMTVHIKVRTKTKPHQTSASQGGPKQTAEVGQMKLPNAHGHSSKSVPSGWEVARWRSGTGRYRLAEFGRSRPEMAMGSIPQDLRPAHGPHSRAFLSRKLALHG
jgi:hypothetical protein